MDSEAFQHARDLLDLNFQSLAMKHMDLKQMELDTAAAKVDELTKQLESLWSDSPAPPGAQAGVPSRMARYSTSPVPEHFGSRGSPQKIATDGIEARFGRSESAPSLHPYSPLSPKGRPSSPRDPYREGYADCATYLADVEQSMGLMHNGVVYALWDYSAEFGDELSFREGESVTVLRRDGPEETDWWWASLHGQEGYVPRNYFGLFPRVKSQRSKI